MKKVFLLNLFVLLFSFILYGQSSSYEYLDMLTTNYVKELQSRNIDTICIYKDYCIGCVYPIKEESDRCSYSSIYIPTYILWIKQGKTFLTKKDNCFDYSTIKIDSTEIWKMFFKYKTRISKEKVKSFEYIVYKNKKKAIYGISIDHSNHRDFEIIVSGNHTAMNFDEFDLQENDRAYTNKNYEHNKKLKSKIIVDELEKLTQAIEEKQLLKKHRR